MDYPFQSIMQAEYLTLKHWEQAQVERWRQSHSFPRWMSDSFIWEAWMDNSGFGSAEEDEAATIDFLKHEVIRREASCVEGLST